MDLELRGLRCFIAVADEGSFTKAAQKLRMTQPALSMRLRELERYFGIDLIRRTTRRIEITERGEELLPHARKLADESDGLLRFVQALRAGDRAAVKVGATLYTIDIPERVAIIESFMAEFPENALTVDNGVQGVLIDNLQRGLLDLALIIGYPVARTEFESPTATQFNNEIVYPSDLPRISLRVERVGLRVPPDSDLCRHAEIPATALSGRKIVMISPDHGMPFFERLTTILNDAGAELVFPPEQNAIAVERYGRQFGLPAITLGWFDPHTGEGSGFVRKNVAGLELTTELVLVSKREGVPPHAQRFWELAQKRCGARTI